MSQVNSTGLRWRTAIGMAVPGALLLGSGLLAWEGLNRSSGNATSIAPILALAGAILAAAVTFSGILVKHALDRRSSVIQEMAERRLELDAEHNRTLAKQAEERLRLDTAIRAVDLIDGKPDHPLATRNAGALFALASLGQLDFALALLASMWPKGEVDAECAMWLVGHALEAGENEQMVAVSILLDNHRVLGGGGSLLWPSGLGFEWKPDLCLNARERLIESLIRTILSVPLRAWNRDALRAAVVILHSASATDRHPRVRGTCLRVLKVLLNAGLARRVIFTPTGNLSVADLRATIDRELATDPLLGDINQLSDVTWQLLADLTRWAAEKQEQPSREQILGSIHQFGGGEESPADEFARDSPEV